MNDTLGHAAGDAVLQNVAKVMVDCTRQTDTVARIGGDEFVILFEGVNEPKILEALAKRLISQLQEPVPYGGRLCKVSASAGTALSVWNNTPFEAAEILHQADLALLCCETSRPIPALFLRTGDAKGRATADANRRVLRDVKRSRMGLAPAMQYPWILNTG